MSNVMTGNLKKMQIIFIAVVLGSVVYLPVVLFIRSGQEAQPADYNDPLFYVCVIAATAAVIWSNLLYKLRLPAIRQKATAQEKIDAWRILLILSIAIVEGATVFAVICLFISGADIFMYIAVALIAVQFMNFPTRRRIQNDLDLNEDEANAL